jgi:hypothetical protein
MALAAQADVIAHALIGSAGDPVDVEILLSGNYPKTYAKDWRRWRLMAACALNACGYDQNATRNALGFTGELPPSCPGDVPNADLRKRAEAARGRLISLGLDVSLGE